MNPGIPGLVFGIASPSKVGKTGPTRVRQMKQNKCFAESKKITKEGRKMEQKLDRWPP